MKTRRRYPGVSPFTPDQGNIFFGRDDDIKKLSRLILLRKQVLLYSKSGIGKSSLLNAGVLPGLSEKFTIVPVRFFAYQEDSHRPPVQSVIAALEETVKKIPEAKSSLLEQLGGEKAFGQSLWYLFKKLTMASDSRANSGDRTEQFIIVFDQFEELFSYPDEQVEEFKEQIYQLTRVDVPDRVMEMMSENREAEDHEQYDDLLERLDLKLVFVIRSDRLNLLNKLSDRIPDIQKVYYELEALDEHNARQAIIQPARQQNEQFEVPPFTYDKEAVDSIIKALTSNDDQSIETTQLQIVCQTIEEIAKKKGGEVVISKADLPDFKDIFLQFYNDSVNRTDEPEKARLFIEDQLIRNGQRISLDANICIDFVSKETLAALENSHLLRAEQNNVGGKSYELSHDTLLDPIMSVKKIRLEEEALKEAERKRAEEMREERERQAKRLKRARTIFLTVTAIGIGLTLILFFYKQSQVSNLRGLEAQQAAMIALQERDLERLRVDSLEVSAYRLQMYSDSLSTRNDSLKTDNAQLNADKSELSEENEMLIKNSEVYKQAVRKLDLEQDKYIVANYSLGLYVDAEKDADKLILSRSGEGKYGYVNKKGKEKIAHLYEDAEPFGLLGIARVEKDGVEMYLDKKGNEYPVVKNISEITQSTLAVDLSSKRLSQIPDQVLNAGSLVVLILDNNNMAIPVDIEDLMKLKYLGLSDNKKLDNNRRVELIKLLGSDVNIRF